MGELVESDTPALEVRFVGTPERGYEIQLSNNEGMDDEAAAALLTEAAEKLGGREDRARGMW
jgi:hypothetical protein